MGENLKSKQANCEHEYRNIETLKIPINSKIAGAKPRIKLIDRFYCIKCLFFSKAESFLDI